MKRISLLAAAWLAAGPLFAADAAPAAPSGSPSVQSGADATGLNEEQKTLYALGVWVANKVQPFSLTAEDLKYVQMGMTDAVLGKKPKVDLETYGDKLNELARSRMSTAADKNKAAGKEYAAKIAKEKGAKKTETGLVYMMTKRGKGPSPKATDTVKVNYEGKLIDGTVFDSSFQRGQPAEFPLNGVIPCWTEGVQKMKVGGEARLICPSSIAYGDSGRPGIPPGATLDFKVQLLEIVKAPKGEEQGPAGGTSSGKPQR